MKRLSLMFAVVVTVAVPVVSQKPRFTIEQVMSSPFPTNLTAAAKANRMAWVFNSRGERNVWMADAPGFEARQVTHYQGDDGQDIFSLRLTPDGKTAVYARGSELSREGNVANPASQLQEPKQQVWAVEAEAGNSQQRLLGDMGCNSEDCEDIRLSPDGRWAVWSGGKHHLWLAPLAGGQAAHQLTELRGEEVDPQWSPDGRHLAFESNRGNHRLIVVVDVGDNGAVSGQHYLSPSADRDFAPRWSADSKQIVFLRRGGAENHVPLIPLRPQSWAIWLADAAGGQAREVWHSGKELTDSLPPFARQSLAIDAGGRIIFASEQDGRNHLYMLPLRGGKPAELTPGDYDVEDVSVSGDRTTLLYTSNQGDVDRRHIWMIRLNWFDPEPKPGMITSHFVVTSGNTAEWSPLMLADGKTIVCLGSSATSPAMPYHLSGTSREMIGSLPKEFPAAQLVEPQIVTFKSEDGLEIHGQLFLPRERKAKMPAVIFAHGGPPRQMMPAFHYMYYYHNAYAENQYLASQGCVVLAVNYRRGIMYGRAFREPADGGWRGSSEYKDILAGAKYLQGLAYVDRKRIGIWGGSYGGLLTALALSRNSDIFAAGVDFHGVHDWSALIGRREEGAEQAPDFEAAMKLAYESSAVATVERWKSPVLLIHGDDDRNVPFQQTTDLAQRLRRRNVEFEELIFPDEIHDFLMWRTWVKGYQATADFFAQRLMR